MEPVLPKPALPLCMRACMQVLSAKLQHATSKVQGKDVDLLCMQVRRGSYHALHATQHTQPPYRSLHVLPPC